MQYLKSVDAIRKSIGTVEADSGKLQDRIHRTGVSILRMFFTKDIKGQEAAELMNELQKASPYHANAFAQWVQAMTPFMWSEETKAWYAHKDAKLTESAFTEARDNPFWKIAPPKAPKPFNLIEELTRAVAKADKRHEDPSKGTDEDVMPKEALRELRSLVQKYATA